MRVGILRESQLWRLYCSATKGTPEVERSLVVSRQNLLSPDVKARGSDRRGHPRFEIVGRFLGSLEVWRNCDVRNLGRGGVLVNTVVSHDRGARFQARVSIGGRLMGVPVAVRHLATRTSPGSVGLVGLEFLEALPDVSHSPFEELDRLTATTSVETERRRFPRTETPAGVQVHLCEWITVTLRDVSLNGAMFLSKVPVEPGTRAQFHTRIGERPLKMEIEVTRLDGGPAPIDFQIGASFVSMDAESRQYLARFLTTTTH